MISGLRAQLTFRHRRFRQAPLDCSLNCSGYPPTTSLYAAMGGGTLGYWDFFPGPPSWGCPPCWGFADVIESRVPSVAVGMRYYGYYPIAETLDVFPIDLDGSGFVDGATHRAKKAAIYNRYLLVSADPLYDSGFEREQVLFRPVFGAGWWLADFVHHRLGHQERHERLAAARMQLDHNILVGPARESIIQHLCLAGIEIVDAWRLGRRIEDFARVDGLRLSLGFPQFLEVNHVGILSHLMAG